MNPIVQNILSGSGLLAVLYGGYITVKAALGAKRMEVGTPSYQALDSRNATLEKRSDVLEEEQNKDRHWIRRTVDWLNLHNIHLPFPEPEWLRHERSGNGHSNTEQGGDVQ